MNFVIVLLTAILLLDCALLILLVLIQLPKKEAGMGLAFGSGATDALFGAGSGNALTNLTKYAAGVFFALVVLISILAQSTFKKNTSAFDAALKQQASKLMESRPAATNAAPAATPAAATNKFVPLSSGSNAAPQAPK
ncbi:MAG TPA: preprotein translocase subunit SecG [Verrucomicrobiales bacterium]|nr:preprotein translocase subunit SecG [Verrucomicrobiales bacterium]